MMKNPYTLTTTTAEIYIYLFVDVLEKVVQDKATLIQNEEKERREKHFKSIRLSYSVSYAKNEILAALSFYIDRNMSQG